MVKIKVQLVTGGMMMAEVDEDEYNNITTGALRDRGDWLPCVDPGTRLPFILNLAHVVRLEKATS
jgi:hypothetical protein